MKKLSEKSLAEIMQAYVFELGNAHQEAGVILYQIDHGWNDKKDYILECLTNALNDDNQRYHKLTPDETYSNLQEDAIGWDGTMQGVASVWM